MGNFSERCSEIRKWCTIPSHPFPCEMMKGLKSVQAEDIKYFITLKQDETAKERMSLCI